MLDIGVPAEMLKVSEGCTQNRVAALTHARSGTRQPGPSSPKQPKEQTRNPDDTAGGHAARTRCASPHRIEASAMELAALVRALLCHPVAPVYTEPVLRVWLW